ncbi:MAG: GHKL domain-containing protein [Clostridia bacterium]|nr:GHKL domain-containing protein [Clostridia bacterium]
MENGTVTLLQVLRFTYGDWGYWAQTVLAAVFTYLLLSDGSGDRKRPLRIVLKLLFLIGAFVGLHLILMLLTYSVTFLAGVSVWAAYALGVILFSLLFCDYDKNARNVVCAACIAIIVIVDEFGVAFGMVLEKTIPGFSVSYMKAAADMLLVVSAWFIIRNPVWKYYLSFPAAMVSIVSNALSAILVGVYELFRIMVFGPEETVGMILLMSIVMIVLYLINSVSYQMIYRLSREQTQVLKLEAQTQIDKSASSLLAVTDSNLNELHKIRHDIQNQYAYMGMLLKNKSYDALESYFEELTGTFSQSIVPFIDCGNRVLDLIFNMEHAKAQEQGIELDVKAATPRTLPFRDVDLCNLFANLIDNALEACAQEQIPNARVQVTVSVRGDYLYSQITNPTRKDKSFLEKRIPTTKQDRRLHGKGISIAKAIVRYYNGQHAVRIENGMYVAEFLLDMTYRQGENHE